MSKSIVIYFSHTGENWMESGVRNIDKGNTEIIAEKISEMTGAELFKVEEVNAYPYDYRECCDVAKKELNEKARPQIKMMLGTIQEYDTIYIASPIWWDHLPMPMFTQLESLDFKGKVVKTVITHEGSGLGKCMMDVEELCDGADIKPGLAIQGHTAPNCDNKLQGWV